MPEITKKKREVDENLQESSESAKKQACENEKSEKDYYYDDAHGYEIYNPDKEDKDDD